MVPLLGQACANSTWREADRVLEQTQRRLGVEVDCDREISLAISSSVRRPFAVSW